MDGAYVEVRGIAVGTGLMHPDRFPQHGGRASRGMLWDGGDGSHRVDAEYLEQGSAGVHTGAWHLVAPDLADTSFVISFAGLSLRMR